LLVLSKADLEKVMSMRDTIEAVEAAFKGLATGEAVMPMPYIIDVPKHNGVWGVKSALINTQDVVGVKLSSGYFENPAKYNLPSITGVVVVADSKHGVPLAVMDASVITAYRTGAVAGVAAKHLARKDSERAAIFGAGAQGRTQLIALAEVLNLAEVVVYDVVPSYADRFADEMAGKVGLKARRAASVEEALRGVDVVSTATPSKTPYIKLEWLPKGTHITTVGSDHKGKQELESRIYDHAKVVVDKREVALEKDYLKPYQIYAELGEVVVGIKRGREGPEEITVMDSSGLGIQDVAAGLTAYQLAKKKNLGTWVEFF
ncbi:MAG: ornithine cyclodeaminase family protein, partial [Nitrososphaerota archaeon]